MPSTSRLTITRHTPVKSLTGLVAAASATVSNITSPTRSSIVSSLPYQTGSVVTGSSGVSTRKQITGSFKSGGRTLQIRRSVPFHQVERPGDLVTPDPTDRIVTNEEYSAAKKRQFGALRGMEGRMELHRKDPGSPRSDGVMTKMYAKHLVKSIRTQVLFEEQAGPQYLQHREAEKARSRALEESAAKLRATYFKTSVGMQQWADWEEDVQQNMQQWEAQGRPALPEARQEQQEKYGRALDGWDDQIERFTLEDRVQSWMQIAAEHEPLPVQSRPAPAKPPRTPSPWSSIPSQSFRQTPTASVTIPESSPLRLSPQPQQFTVDERRKAAEWARHRAVEDNCTTEGARTVINKLRGEPRPAKPQAFWRAPTRRERHQEQNFVSAPQVVEKAAPIPAHKLRAFSRAPFVSIRETRRRDAYRAILREAGRQAAEVAREYFGQRELESQAPEVVHVDAVPTCTEVGDISGPFELDATTAPVELEATPAPIELDATSAPIELDATPAPVELDTTFLDDHSDCEFDDVEDQQSSEDCGVIATLKSWAGSFCSGVQRAWNAFWET